MREVLMGISFVSFGGMVFICMGTALYRALSSDFAQAAYCNTTAILFILGMHLILKLSEKLK